MKGVKQTKKTMTHNLLSSNEVQGVMTKSSDLKEYHLRELIAEDNAKLSDLKLRSMHIRELGDAASPAILGRNVVSCYNLNEIERHIVELGMRIVEREYELNELMMFQYISTKTAVEKIDSLRAAGDEFHSDLLAAQYIEQNGGQSRKRNINEFMNGKYSCLKCGAKESSSKMNIHSRDYTNRQTKFGNGGGFQCLNCGHEDYGQSLESGFFSGANWKPAPNKPSKTEGRSMKTHLNNSTNILLNISGPSLSTMPLKLREEIGLISNKYNQKLSIINEHIRINELLSSSDIKYFPRAIDLIRDVISDRDENISPGWNRCLAFLMIEIFNMQSKSLELLRDTLFKVIDEYVIMYLKFVEVMKDDPAFTFIVPENSGSTSKRVNDNISKISSRRSNLLFEYIIFQLLYITLDNHPSFKDDINYVLDFLPRVRTKFTLERYELLFYNFIHQFVNNDRYADIVGHKKYKWSFTQYFMGDFRSFIIKVID